MKRNLFSMLLAVMFTFSTAQAKVWIVDSNSGSKISNFTSLSSAHSGASSGDTLYVIGSSNSYGSNITLSKKLTIIGPGYFLTENDSTQANYSNAKCIGVIFNSGSSGSTIMGMSISGTVDVNTDNITVTRNYINTSSSDNRVDIAQNCSNIVISQNYIYGNSSYCIYINSSCYGILIFNNYIYNTATSSSYYAISSFSQVDVRNCVISGNIYIGSSNFDFANNILRYGTFSGSSNVPRNCIGSGAQFATGNNNKQNVSMSSVFVNSGSTDGKWQLAENSPAIKAGLNGDDCGMFGGDTPYILSGIPPIPTIYYLDAPVSVPSSAEGLSVEVKIKSRN